MTELNGIEPRKITTKGPFSFSIGDTSSFTDHISGGTFTQVKQPKEIKFVSRTLVIVSGLSLTLCVEIACRVVEGTRVLLHRLRQVRPPSHSSRRLPGAVGLL